jgi:hypothetical protein
MSTSKPGGSTLWRSRSTSVVAPKTSPLATVLSADDPVPVLKGFF